VFLASAFTLSVVAIVLAAASLVISWWQANIKWQEFRDRRKARIAVDPEPVNAAPDHWRVVLWLTNVGASHARRVRVWLENKNGDRMGNEERLPRPLLAGGESESVEILVPRGDDSTLEVRAVRKWRDARESEEPWEDRSEQWIRLE